MTTQQDVMGEFAPPTEINVSWGLKDTVRSEVGAPNNGILFKGTASNWKRVSHQGLLLRKRVSQQGLLLKKRVSHAFGTASFEACFPIVKNEIAPSFLQIDSSTTLGCVVCNIPLHLECAPRWHTKEKFE